ncbi:hypothetical protein VMUT_1696 [Vulcanisaeta moutnovskia 768-28]|uniref:PaREP5ab n=1 Tax=Vulcanisaeta moutnovskia (strain 768-28) TaxID=985053 RepID=F0QUJ1_VULM7|nr:hypothetical protein [Vulcanisaeta moutnovskia]ADY01900.1 hypothetical protein VMUT_1696 [Vulcanisaeta moutnovskia 768-28]
MDATLIASIIGPIVTIVTILGTTLYWLGGKFKEIDMRFREIDMRFGQINEKFEEIDRRFEEVDKRFEEMNKRFERVDERFDRLEKNLKSYVDEKFDILNARISRLAEAYSDYQEFFVEYLTAEGLLKAEKASMLRNEARRVMRLAASGNPLSKEEWDRIKELLDKDVLTLEEALELRELARKVVKEYGEYPEAWKLHIYASIMVGEAIRRQSQQQQQGQREQGQQKQC